ncbi:MAG: PIG-L family deacetylase [Firmicutes bacterium]|nr:PIG-L family deacetylase [Bacillota bacterium]
MQQILENILNNSKYRIPFPSCNLPEVKGSILVLSPHFDDDIIGCGGTLLKYQKQGEDIHIVYITDGKKGKPEAISNKTISRIRYDEAKEATGVLGIPLENTYCLNIPDGCVDSHSTNIKLEEIIKIINPVLVFTPYILDIHHDHRGTNTIFANLLKFNHCESLGIKDIIMYEVWTPLLQNLCINITEQFRVKIKALEKHQTQLKIMNYVGMVTSLNAYRASFFNNKMYKYVEAFYHCSVQEYQQLMRYVQSMEIIKKRI